MHILWVLALAAAGGFAGQAAGVPAGALIGSLLAVGGYNLWSDGAARVPPILRHAGRALVGTAVGSLVAPSLVAAFLASAVWAILFAGVAILTGLCAGHVLARVTGLDLATSLIACAPGGMSEMSALADEFQIRAEVVVGVHLLRKLLILGAVTTVLAVTGHS